MQTPKAIRLSIVIAILVIVSVSTTATAFAGSKRIDLSNAVFTSSFSHPNRVPGQYHDTFATNDGYFKGGIHAGEDDCSMYGEGYFDPRYLHMNVTEGYAEHDGFYPTQEWVTPTYSVENGHHTIHIQYTAQEWAQWEFDITVCGDEEIVIVPPPTQVENKDCVAFGSWLDLAGTTVWAALWNANQNEFWGGVHNIGTVNSNGQVKFQDSMENGNWGIWISNEQPPVDERGVVITQPVRMIQKGSSVTNGLSTEATCSDVTAESDSTGEETFMIGDTSNFMLDGAVFRNMPVGYDCDGYAGFQFVGTFPVQNDGTLIVHSSEFRAKKAHWGVGSCQERIRVSVQLPNPTPIVFTADPCEGPECPAARCGLMEGTFIWNAAANMHFGILQGEPTWFASYEDAVTAGLTFNGGECSNCGIGWQFRQLADGSFQGWFGPNSTIADSEVAAQDFFGSSKDAYEVAVELQQAWANANQPLEGIWATVTV